LRKLDNKQTKNASRMGKQIRKKLKDKIHTYQDNKSRERLYNKLVELGWI